MNPPPPHPGSLPRPSPKLLPSRRRADSRLTLAPTVGGRGHEMWPARSTNDFPCEPGRARMIVLKTLRRFDRDRGRRVGLPPPTTRPPSPVRRLAHGGASRSCSISLRTGRSASRDSADDPDLPGQGPARGCALASQADLPASTRRRADREHGAPTHNRVAVRARRLRRSALRADARRRNAQRHAGWIPSHRHGAVERGVHGVARRVACGPDRRADSPHWSRSSRRPMPIAGRPSSEPHGRAGSIVERDATFSLAEGLAVGDRRPPHSSSRPVHRRGGAAVRTSRARHAPPAPHERRAVDYGLRGTGRAIDDNGAASPRL